MEYENKMNAIIEWAESKSSFDASTFTGMKDFYESEWGGHFTISMKSAIDNVYDKWKVGKWAKNNGY